MLGAPVASAEPPVRLGTYVVDSAQALDSAQLDRVRGAVDNLYADQQLRLWIVYVRDFAGLGPQNWAEQTARKSGFGNRDLLLAVATQDRDYWFYGELPSSITDSDLSDLLVGQVEPALRDGRWADAGVVTANRIDTELRGRTISAGALLIVGAVIAAAIAGFALYSRHRSRDRARAELAAARRVNPDDSVALAALPLDALHARSREALVELDNAIRTSSEELELAAGEFGAIAAAPFRTALDHAKDAAAKAFSIRQRLDDEIPETPDEQRALLVDLLGTVGRADRELDAQVTEFDTMRNLLIDGPARLDALTRDLVALTGRIPASEAEWTRLTGTLNEAVPSQRRAEPPPEALANEPKSSPDLRRAEPQPRTLAIGRTSIASQRPAEPQSRALTDERTSAPSQYRDEPQSEAFADERASVPALRQPGPPHQAPAYPAEALAPIADNISMARERIAFAEQNIDAGRAALARPVGEQGAAVGAIRAAEAAVGQANSLLDAVDGFAADIEQARAGIPAALDGLRREIAEATGLSDYGGAELAAAVGAAQDALAAAAAKAAIDPLTAFHDAVAADGELDRAVAAATDRKLAAEDLRRRLEHALTDAGARVNAAADYITTRRGGIDAEARTRLSEAQRNLDLARRLASTDPQQAITHARTAADLGGRALASAQASVRAWAAAQPPSGTAQAGAVLGGILIDGLLRGAGTAYRSGPTGDYGAASYGGSQGSRRIGRGGRF